MLYPKVPTFSLNVILTTRPSAVGRRADHCDGSKPYEAGVFRWVLKPKPPRFVLTPLPAKSSPYREDEPLRDAEKIFVGDAEELRAATRDNVCELGSLKRLRVCRPIPTVSRDEAAAQLPRRRRDDGSEGERGGARRSAMGIR